MIQADPHKKKELNMEKKKYILYLNAYWYFSKRCRLTIFPWASVPILDFLEKFATSATCVTKLTLVLRCA